MTKFKINKKYNFTLKLLENNKVVQRLETRSIRCLYNKIRTINWIKPYSSVYLRVGYGKLLASSGKYENFWNDGVYNNKKDFILALNAFTE